MLAPPKPPSYGELEALIKEARERQLRRRLLGAAGVAIAAAVGLSIYALTAGTPIRSATAHRGRPRMAPPCTAPGGWHLAFSGVWSEPTGEHTAPLKVTRVGAQPCALDGFPRIVLLDARGQRLGFRYSHSGDLVVAARKPRVVRVRGGDAAYFLLNKFRCDLRTVSLARWLRVKLPGVRGWLALQLPRYPMIEYCPADPASQTIAVSPLASRLSQVAARLQ
jgi:hypothetical protein